MNVITAAELKAKLPTAGAEFFLLDVRENAEVAEIAMQDAGDVLHIPMGDVKEHLGSIPRNKTVVVICRSGARSAMVGEYLLEQGYADILNLTGGIIAWEKVR